MKKLTRVLSICLFSVLLISMSSIKKADAYTVYDKSWGWGFGIGLVAEVQDGKYVEVEPQKDGIFHLHNDSIAMLSRVTPGDSCDNCSIHVDDNYIGRCGDRDLSLYYEMKNNEARTIFKVPNLTPGKHKITLIQNQPWYLRSVFNPHKYTGPDQKKCTIYVIVPDNENVPTSPDSGNVTTSSAVAYN